LAEQLAVPTADPVAGVVAWLRRVNRRIALASGIALLATGVYILVEIVLRQTPLGAQGGGDEISGYVMAAFATWGFSFALLEQAHVRIDLVQQRLPRLARVLLDLLAMAALTVTTWLVSFHAWGVLATTLDRGSRANTPLETPLWIPQTLWFAGWVWFALTSSALLVCLLMLLWQRRLSLMERIAGNNPGGEAAE